MADYTEKKCPKCGQQLRFPDNIGGMLMACPSCGNKFHSDFKFGGIKKRGIVEKIFAMPLKIINRISRYLTS